MKKFLFIFFLTMFSVSCSNDTALSPNYAPGWQPPLVTGMQLMNEVGLEIGVWGSPDFPEGDTSQSSIRLNYPYPNPAAGGITIDFVLSDPTAVKVWVTPAQWTNQSGENYTNSFSEMLIDAGGAKAVKILSEGTEELSPGVYGLYWSNSRDDPEQVPPGFYRIYVTTDETTLWRDVYICKYGEKLPAGLPQFGCR